MATELLPRTRALIAPYQHNPKSTLAKGSVETPTERPGSRPTGPVAFPSASA